MIIDYTIDQVSQIVGVPKSKLRYWESTYKIPVKRTAGRNRRYPQEMVGIFQRIKELDDYGFTAKGIKRKLEEMSPHGWPPPDPSCID